MSANAKLIWVRVSAEIFSGEYDIQPLGQFSSAMMKTEDERTVNRPTPHSNRFCGLGRSPGSYLVRGSDKSRGNRLVAYRRKE